MPDEAKGHPPAIPPHLASVIRRWVIEGPISRGLDRANWTHAELADHLRKAHGIKAAARQRSSAAAASGSDCTARVTACCGATRRSRPRPRRSSPLFCAMSGGFIRRIGISGWCWSSTTPRGIGASRSMRRWPTTRTGSLSGCRATARNSTSSSTSGSYCGGGRHNRFLEGLLDLKRSIRASLCCFHPGEPVLLPDGKDASSQPGRQVVPPPWQPDSSSGFVN